MNLSPPEIIRAKLEDSGKDVHFLRVTQDRQVMICRTTNTAYSDVVHPLPFLFVHLCIDGGGSVRRFTNLHQLDANISPGAIGALPPGSKGTGHWPEMTAITFAISMSAVTESIGKSWLWKLKSKAMSQIFRDPLVEAIMMDMGCARAGSASDSALVHAAHLITHQLFDQPFDDSSKVSGVIPLGKAKIDRLKSLLDANLDRYISVTEMADVAGLSRFHFSRCFKAATGQSPLQFAIVRKLEHAATLLEKEQNMNILNVAQSVGFTNPSHFARAFRRHYGLSPRHWKSEQMRSDGV